MVFKHNNPGCSSFTGTGTGTGDCGCNTTQGCCICSVFSFFPCSSVYCQFGTGTGTGTGVDYGNWVATFNTTFPTNLATLSTSLSDQLIECREGDPRIPHTYLRFNVNPIQPGTTVFVQFARADDNNWLKMQFDSLNQFGTGTMLRYPMGTLSLIMCVDGIETLLTKKMMPMGQEWYVGLTDGYLVCGMHGINYDLIDIDLQFNWTDFIFGTGTVPIPFGDKFAFGTGTVTGGEVTFSNWGYQVYPHPGTGTAPAYNMTDCLCLPESKRWWTNFYPPEITEGSEDGEFNCDLVITLGSELPYTQNPTFADGEWFYASNNSGSGVRDPNNIYYADYAIPTYVVKGEASLAFATWPPNPINTLFTILSGNWGLANPAGQPAGGFVDLTPVNDPERGYFEPIFVYTPGRGQPLKFQVSTNTNITLYRDKDYAPTMYYGASHYVIEHDGASHTMPTLPMSSLVQLVVGEGVLRVTNCFAGTLFISGNSNASMPPDDEFKSSSLGVASPPKILDDYPPAAFGNYVVGSLLPWMHAPDGPYVAQATQLVASAQEYKYPGFYHTSDTCPNTCNEGNWCQHGRYPYDYQVYKDLGYPHPKRVPYCIKVHIAGMECIVDACDSTVGTAAPSPATAVVRCEQVNGDYTLLSTYMPELTYFPVGLVGPDNAPGTYTIPKSHTWRLLIPVTIPESYCYWYGAGTGTPVKDVASAIIINVTATATGIDVFAWFPTWCDTLNAAAYIPLMSGGWQVSWHTSDYNLGTLYSAPEDWSINVPVVSPEVAGFISGCRIGTGTFGPVPTCTLSLSKMCAPIPSTGTGSDNCGTCTMVCIGGQLVFGNFGGGGLNCLNPDCNTDCLLDDGRRAGNSCGTGSTGNVFIGLCTIVEETPCTDITCTMTCQSNWSECTGSIAWCSLGCFFDGVDTRWRELPGPQGSKCDVFPTTGCTLCVGNSLDSNGDTIYANKPCGGADFNSVLVGACWGGPGSFTLSWSDPTVCALSNCLSCTVDSGPNAGDTCTSIGATIDGHCGLSLGGKWTASAQALSYEGWKTRRPVIATKPEEVPPNKPGAETFFVIKEFGIQPKKGCKCVALSRQMDAWGYDGCQEHKEEVLEAMRANLTHYSTLEMLSAAAHSFFSGKHIYSVEAVFEEGMRRTKEKMDK